MGINVAIPVLGLTHLTEGCLNKLRCKRFAEIMLQFNQNEYLNEADYSEILKKLDKNAEPESSPDVVSYNSQEKASNSCFLNHFLKIPNIKPRDLLLRYVIAFELDMQLTQKVIWENFECDCKGNDTGHSFLKKIVEFTLIDLSRIIMDYINTKSMLLYKADLSKIQSLHFIMKVHSMYMRISRKQIERLCLLSFPFLIKSIKEITKESFKIGSPIAFKIYSIAGTELRLEQRYQNPRMPLIATHLILHQNLLASLCFWTSDAQSIFNFLNNYKKKQPNSKEDQKEIKEILFSGNEEFGKSLMDEFVNNSVFDINSFTLCCMACCMDPRETFNECLWNCLNQEGKLTIPSNLLADAIKTISIFSLRTLGKLIKLQINIENKLCLQCIDKLMKISEAEINDLLPSICPVLKYKPFIEKQDIQIIGDDCLVFRLVDLAATQINARGKIIEQENETVPLYLLGCRSFIKELKFSWENACDIYQTFINVDPLGRLHSINAIIGKSEFLNHFKKVGTEEIDENSLLLGALSICLDHNNTLQDCIWKLLGNKEVVKQEDMMELAIKIGEISIKGISEIVLEQLIEGNNNSQNTLCQIQKKFINIKKEEILQIIKEVMPFVNMSEIKKNNLRFNANDERLIYALLKETAHLLHLDDEFLQND